MTTKPKENIRITTYNLEGGNTLRVLKEIVEHERGDAVEINEKKFIVSSVVSRSQKKNGVETDRVITYTLKPHE